MDKKAEKLEAALVWARRQHRAALARKRGAGDPRNPFRGKPGQEEAFAAAAQDAAALETILTELERGRAVLALEEKTRRPRRTPGGFLWDFVGMFLIGAASLGAGALAADTVHRVGAALGVSPWAVLAALAGLALAATIWNRGAKR